MTKYKVIQGFGGDSRATIIVADRYTFSDSSKVARFFNGVETRVDKAIAVFTDVASITVVDGAASSPIPAPVPPLLTPLLPPTWPWPPNTTRPDTYIWCSHDVSECPCKRPRAPLVNCGL